VNPDTRKETAAPSLDVLAEIDAVCDRFEAEWRAGRRPQVEDYLPQVAEAARPQLVEELLRLDLHYRRQHGDEPRLTDYQARLPVLSMSKLAELLASPGPAAPPVSTPTSSQASTGALAGEAGPDGHVMAAPAHRPAATPAARVFGGYDILRELGRGGMGVVYLARQRGAGRLVALKLIRLDRLEHLSAAQRRAWTDRFRTEGQAAARVADDHVVTVYEVGVVGGVPFYSMRYVEGQALSDLIEDGPLLNARAAALMEKVARAVQAVHEQGILHRDLKPQNVMVDGRGRPYVGDFGLAKLLDEPEGVTVTGEGLGSPPYMSPEQATDAARVGPAADVYGLGATLYALLTGQPPFQGRSVAETLHQVKYREPVPPRRLNAGVARDLETVCLKCLEKDPARRYGSAGKVADELRRYLDGVPIVARPVGLPGRLGRWCRRNPMVAGLAAAAVLLLAVAGVAYRLYRDTADSARTVAGRADELAGQREAALAARQEEERKAREAEDRKWAQEYLVDMARADRAFLANDLDAVRPLLAKYQRPGEGTDHRGWEWYYLQAEVDQRGAYREAPAHTYGWNAGFGGTGLAWDAASRRLAFVNGERMITLWDAATGRTIRSLGKFAGTLPLQRAVWCPDGRRVATCSWDDTVQVWDAASGARLTSLRAGPVRGVAWSPDARRLAVLSGGLVIWDTVSGRQLIPQVHHGPVGLFPPAWSPDSRWLAYQDGYGVGVIDGRSGVEGLRPSSIGRAIAWSPDGNRLLIQKFNPSGVLVWDAGVAKITWQTNREVMETAWSPDGKQVALCGAQGVRGTSSRVHVLDAASGQELRVLSRQNVWSLQQIWDARPSTLHSDGQRPVVVTDRAPTQVVQPWSGQAQLNQDRTMFAWLEPGMNLKIVQVGTGKELLKVSVAATASELMWSPDGKWLTWEGQDGHVYVWSRQHGSMTLSLGGQHIGGHLLNGRARWSPDSRWLIIGRGETLQAWDVARGTPGPSVRCGQLYLPDQELSWAPDGRRLLTARRGQPAVVWDLVSNRTLELGEAPEVWSAVTLRWSPAGEYLAAGYGGGLVRIWDPASGRLLRTLRDLQQPVAGNFDGGDIASLAWNPDARYLAGARRDGFVCIWDAHRWIQVRRWTLPRPNAPPPSHTHPPTPAGLLALAWDPGSARLACGTSAQVRVWDSRDGKEVLVLPGPGRSIAWAPDGTRLAVASGDHALKVWDAVTGQRVFVVRELTHPHVLEAGQVRKVVWSPDGRRLAATTVASAGGHVKLWDVASGTELLTLSSDHGSLSPEDLAWSPDGRRLAGLRSGPGPQWSIVLWEGSSPTSAARPTVATPPLTPVRPEPDPPSRRPGQETPGAPRARPASGVPYLYLRYLGRRGEHGVPTCVACSPDGRRALSGGFDRSVCLWDLEHGQSLLRLTGHQHTVYTVAFSPDGRRGLSGSEDRTLRLWDLKMGQELQRLEGHGGVISSVAFLPDGRHVISGAWDGTARLWDLETATEVGRFNTVAPVLSLALTRDGKHVLFGSNDGKLRYWDVRTRTEVRAFPGPANYVLGVALTGDGRRALAAGADGLIHVYDVASGREDKPLRGHTAQVYCVALSPDGSRVLSCGEDRTIRLWDLAAGRELARGYGGGTVRWAAFSPDGRHAVSACDDRAVGSWALPR
jgi:WD40 repeat protein/predicted Ser/Thr protein kinase